MCSGSASVHPGGDARRRTGAESSAEGGRYSDTSRKKVLRGCLWNTSVKLSIMTGARQNTRKVNYLLPKSPFSGTAGKRGRAETVRCRNSCST